MKCKHPRRSQPSFFAPSWKTLSCHKHPRFAFSLGEADGQTQTCCSSCVGLLIQALKISLPFVAVEWSSDWIPASLPYCSSLEESLSCLSALVRCGFRSDSPQGNMWCVYAHLSPQSQRATIVFRARGSLRFPRLPQGSLCLFHPLSTWTRNLLETKTVSFELFLQDNLVFCSTYTPQMLDVYAAE